MADLLDAQRIHVHLRRDLLFLLVGANPLPNAVSALLLTDAGAQIVLLYTSGSAGVADALTAWLRLQGRQAQLVQIDDADPADIYAHVQQYLGTAPASGRIGLNYTGGTKTMAVHTHRALADWAGRTHADVEFSYLDARSLRMYFDPPLAAPTSPGTSVYVGDAVRMDLDDLLRIHGWRLAGPANAQPFCPSAAAKLAALCCSGGWHAWRQWVGQEVIGKCKRGGNRRNKWQTPAALQNVRLTLPDGQRLAAVAAALRNDLGLHTTARSIPLSQVPQPEKLCAWLDGVWLEHYVLGVLLQMAGKVGFSEVQQGVEVEAFGGVRFEVDVVAILNYQLFAFSCTTQADRGTQKLKLFEASVRAQQMGGDESRVALVCCTNDPDSLQQEMREQLTGSGHVAVFGCRDLLELPERIEHWVTRQVRP